MREEIEYEGRTASFEYDATAIDGLSELAQANILKLCREAGIPSEGAIAGWAVVQMQAVIEKLDEKVDMLIDENMELREQVNTMDNGLAFLTRVNEELGEENARLKKELEGLL